MTLFSRSSTIMASCHTIRSALTISLLLLLLIQIPLIESQAARVENVTINSSSTQAPVSSIIATPTTTAQPGITMTQQVTVNTTNTSEAISTSAAVSSTTMREPSEQEIQEARRLIHEIGSMLKDSPGSRMVVNRPTISSQNQDFAPDSPEAKIADATSQFGLEFIKSLPSPSSRQNVVISPISMQILLNIILLGSKDHSPTQVELMEVLGYSAAYQLAASSNATTEQERLIPHAATHSLLEHISRATHLTVEDHQQQQQQQLLNSNGQLGAHLQTSAREGVMPLSGQVNFTLANLMLTNSDLTKTSAKYEKDLKSFYDIKLEHFSGPLRQTHQQSNATGVHQNETSRAISLHERVNKWVQNITQGQIGRLVEEADLAGGDLAMVLLNAAHFKGRWLHTFNTRLTQDRVFYNEGQEIGARETSFMRQNGVFGYGEFGATGERSSAASGGHQHTSSLSDETVLTEDLARPTTTTSTTASVGPAGTDNKQQQNATVNDEEQQQMAAEAKRYELTAKLNCSALMLPFSLNDGQELSMVVLLPNKRDGLQDLINNLDGPALNEIYKSLNEQQVQVELPKFSFESSHDARATLIKMGLSKIFKDGAELDRMFADPGASSQVMPPVKVDKVIHKAKIAVDEVGAEAAAASAATIVLRNLIRPPNPSFVADHPFMFVIRHNRSNLPLFLGLIERL